MDPPTPEELWMISGWDRSQPDIKSWSEYRFGGYHVYGCEGDALYAAKRFMRNDPNWCYHPVRVK